MRSVNNIEEEVLVKDSFQYFSLLETLTLIYKNENLYVLIMSEPLDISTNFIKSYTDCMEYKNHPLFREYSRALRIVLYYDEIEIVNPIGTKTIIHKLSIFYYTIQNFPAYFNCKLENIQILAICYALDVKKYGYSEILKPFIIELNQLEDGIVIDIRSTAREMRGTLIVFTGDTLACHDIFELLSD